MTFNTQTFLQSYIFAQHWTLFSLHCMASGGPSVGHVHDGPHAGLHLVPPPDHPRGHTASVPALATAGQQLPGPRWNIQQRGIKWEKFPANMFLPREEFLDFILEIIFLNFWFFSV